MKITQLYFFHLKLMYPIHLKFVFFMYTNKLNMSLLFE